MSKMYVEITYTVDGLEGIMEEYEDGLYEALDVGLAEYVDLIHADEQEMTYGVEVVWSASTFEASKEAIENQLHEEIEIGDVPSYVSATLGNVSFEVVE